MKKRNKLKKGLAILLTAAMVVGLVPGMGTMQVSATESDENTVNTVSSNDTMTQNQTVGQATDKLITTWQWIDEEEYLDEETGNLALPGASEQTPAYFEDVTAFLPTQIQATVVNEEDSDASETIGEETISLGDWECDNYPEDGAYQGIYTFTAALPEGYVLSEEAKALEVLVELGGAQTYESAESVTVGAFTVTGGTLDEDYTYADGVLTISNVDTPIKIANTDPTKATTDRIEVDAWSGANITLAGVNIDVSGLDNTAAFKISEYSSGDVTIILADNSGNTLISGSNCAGLQKDGGEYADKLAIQGGTNGTGKLAATGGESGAGIGGGESGTGSNIEIIGGTVTATGGYQGAGIGGGYRGIGSNITINGGTVTATGSGKGAGIGGGENGSGSNITISDGTVTATGDVGGAGIGGGSGGSGSNIKISAGTVTATGGWNDAGIGGGEDGSGSDITISGGTVTATGSGKGAGIGGAGSFGSDITISGGTVTATGREYGAGIGGGYSGSNITISGGTVTATSGINGAGIGGGDCGSGSNITISGGSVKAGGKNAIGGGDGYDAITPTSDGTTPVYLLEIENEAGADITINETPYPTNHNGEKKIYAYLPAKTVTEPNVVNVDTEETKYIYDTKWLIVAPGEYDENGFCTNYEWKDGSLVLKDGIADGGHTDCDGYQPATLTKDTYDINNDGTKDNVYEISNVGQLYWFAGLVNGTLSGVDKNISANAVLTADITVNKGNTANAIANCDGTKADGWIDWTPIGTSETNFYAGTFDGQGHTVSGLYFNNSETNYVGLFGYICHQELGNGNIIYDGTIKNIGVVDSYFYGLGSVGGVCGESSGTIANCFNTSTVKGNTSVGGVCGWNKNGTITNCYNTGTVTATGTAPAVGGVCGNNGYEMANCYYLDGTTTDKTATSKTAVQFASGEVAYLLSQGTDGSVWGQKLGDNGDTYPVLKKEWDVGNTVYQNIVYSGCSESNQGDTTYVYANNAADPVYAAHTIGENGICSKCNQKLKYKVSLTSTVDGTDAEDTVALLTGGGLYTIGTEATVTAPEKEGFTFKGWYNSEYGAENKPRSEKLSYTFTPEEDTSLVAVYEANASITLNVNGEMGGYNVNGELQASNSYTRSFKAGSYVFVGYSGRGTFCYWKNASGNIVSRDREYEFMLVSDTSLTAVAVGDSAGSEESGYSSLIEFVSCYGQVIQATTWNSKDEASGKTLPAAPSKFGGTFKYWSLDGTNEATAATILAAINGSTTRITVVPVYKEITSTYSITVKYPSDSSKDDVVYDNQKLGNTLTVTADSIEGKEFAYWSSDAAGTTKLSYSQSYFLLVSGDTTLYPIYSNTAVEEQPVVAITNVSRNTVDSKNKLSFEVTRSVPAKYELIEQGVIYSVSGTYGSDEAAMVMGAGSVYKFVSSDTANNGVFIAYMNVTGHEDSKLYVKGYVIVKNTETGNTETIYTDMSSKSYNDLAQD